jgi:hypothetical protein
MSANEAIRNRALTSIFVSNEKFWTTLGAKPPENPTFYQLLTMRENDVTFYVWGGSDHNFYSPVFTSALEAINFPRDGLKIVSPEQMREQMLALLEKIFPGN